MGVVIGILNSILIKIEIRAPSNVHRKGAVDEGSWLAERYMDDR